MDRYAEHQKLVNDILREYGALPGVRIWKNSTGTARSHDGQRVISFGLKGSADIMGIIAPAGRFLAIEVKTGSAKQNKNQLAFARMIEKMGGIYVVARSLSDLQFLLPD